MRKICSELFGALSYHFPQQNIKLSLTSSVFQTDENENFDILGEYRLNDIKMDLKEEDKEGALLGLEISRTRPQHFKSNGCQHQSYR